MKILLAFSLLLLGCAGYAAAAIESATLVGTDNGHFLVTYQSRLQPVVINQMHAWSLHVTDADGNAVSDAVIAVKGGMPQHNHGLATAPTVESLGDGNYLLQGLRFHMLGYWELVLTITAADVTDQVTIALTL